MTDCVRTVDPLDVMRKSLRVDLIFKVELADAWLHGDAASMRVAEEAYLESIRARCGFHESDPPKSGPEAYVTSFRETLASISARGYDEKADPVPVDRDGELLGGAHRVASCVACGCPCRIVELPHMSTGGSRRAAFQRGKMATAVENWGMRAYLRRFPDGRLAQEFAASLGPDAPFPDWASRAREMRMDSWLWLLRENIQLFKAVLRRGERRRKALKKADEYRHRASAPFMLARYWHVHADA
jgi:hypothetical protein